MAIHSINSLAFGGDTHVFTIPYGVCSTAGTTAAKTVSVENFSLEQGASLRVKFNNTNTATSPTLNVNSTGAKAIYCKGQAVATGQIMANQCYDLVYNGTQWELVNNTMAFVTQAQYNALGDRVKSDGIVYFISSN